MSTPKNGSSGRPTTGELPPGPQLASKLASLGMRRRPGMGEVGPARRSPRDKAFIDDLAELKRLGPLFPAESQADGDDIESYAAAAIAMDAYLTVVERLHGGTMPGDSPIELTRAGDAISARLALEPGSVYLKFLDGKRVFEATGKNESSTLASLGTELARAHAAHVTEALTPGGELSCAYDCPLAEIWDQAMHTGTPPALSPLPGLRQKIRRGFFPRQDILLRSLLQASGLRHLHFAETRYGRQQRTREPRTAGRGCLPHPTHGRCRRAERLVWNQGLAGVSRHVG